MKILLTLIIVLSVKLAFAQQPAEVWETINSYPNTGSLTVRHSINDGSGNTYSTGYFYGASSDHDMFVSKHDNNGNLVFNDTYDSGIGYDWGIEVGFDNSGNTYVVANIRGSSILQGAAVMTRKYSPTGTLLWTNLFYSAITSAKANDMQVNKNTGEVYIVGYSANQVTADAKNIMVLKYLADGTLSWSKSFDGGSSIDDIAYLMKLDNTGSIYVLGETNAAVLGPPGTNLLLKYTTTGALSWSKIPQTSGENGAVLRNEGTNFSVYDFFTKQRYTKSTGLLNETVTFENTFQVTSPVLRFWKLGDGRYVRTMSPNSIQVFDASGNELSNTFINQYTDIQMDSDNSLYLCSFAPGDSAQVKKRSLVGDSYNWVDFTYRFYQAGGAWPKFDLSDNNTFTVASQYSSGSVITHRACIPPNVSVTMTGLELSGNVCPGDTVFFNATSDYATSYSWWGNTAGPNTDSMYIWGGNSQFITQLGLGVIVDAGNGCMVNVDMNFGGYQMIDTYIVNNFVGNCEGDQGYLQSLSTGGIYRFNWYYNGIQQTFDALDYNHYLTMGNGSYELSLLDVVTNCRSIPHAIVDVTTIQAQDDASYSYASANYCPAGTDPTPIITGNLGGMFTAIPVGLSINSSSGEVDLSLSTPGPYTVSYATNGTCPDTVEFSLLIEALADASFSYASINFCGNDPNALATLTGTVGGTFSATPTGLDIDPSTGEIDFSLSSANSYSIDYQTNGACSVSSQVNVTVTLEDLASVSYSGGLNYCQNEVDPIPSITGTLGGTFSANPAGLVINSSTGEIDLSSSTPAAYSVKYLTSGLCPDSITGTITVSALDNASFGYASANYCENEANATPTVTGTLGGTFSATPAGLTIDPSTGEIDFSLSMANTYTIDYQTNGACPTSSQVNLTLTLEDFALVAYPVLNYCQNDVDPTPSIMGTAGGTFSALPSGLIINPSTGELDLATSVPNTYTIKYLTSGTCPDSTSSSITIDLVDDASFIYGSGTFCLSGSDPLPTISGLAGGTFSGTGGVVINTSTGEIDIASSGIGNYTITYQTNGNCPNWTDFNLVITDSPDASFSYNPIVFCISELPISAQFGAGAGGGIFSATPSGLNINASTGEIDPLLSTPNVYTVTNYIAASGGCSTTSFDFQVEVLVTDDASFAYSQIIYFSNEPNPTPTITGLVGGSFNEPSGNVVLNASTGEIDLASSTIGGPYTIEYLTSGPCPSMESFQLTIEEPLSIFNQEFEHLVIYPNPMSDILNIDIDGGTIDLVELYDLNGRLVHQSAGTNQLNVSELHPAMYFIQVTIGDTIYQQRLIKH
ncbi:MAG: T9SS type A sorting domain-containing protein [Crocinitomicaceae bacterium]|nr:T9SS type A sorting domain-containing protein [Flavobacteriales bacterium]NQZ36047.1 T9SS type A sorting domain-containing protein [Crocinitomicaceae bacterium]